MFELPSLVSSRPPGMPSSRMANTVLGLLVLRIKLCNTFGGGGVVRMYCFFGGDVYWCWACCGGFGSSLVNMYGWYIREIGTGCSFGSVSSSVASLERGDHDASRSMTQIKHRRQHARGKLCLSRLRVKELSRKMLQWFFSSCRHCHLCVNFDETLCIDPARPSKAKSIIHGFPTPAMPGVFPRVCCKYFTNIGEELRIRVY